MRTIHLLSIILAAILIMPPQAVMPSAAEKMPQNFVEIRELIPDIQLDIRYFGSHNFVGEKINAYNAPKCFLTREAAAALAKVQQELNIFSLQLKIYDCYRPQQAVDHFVKWAAQLDNIKTKKEFYPTVDKRHLFKDGYIDSKSGHSRGSTVDLTIITSPASSQASYTPGQKLSACYLRASKRFRDNSIDMGTGFDCFHELSHTANKSIGQQQRANRMLLKTLMEKHGFRNYSKEWWHYTLNNEPYPDTYFDFAIE